MGWRDRLRPASFRGIPFFVEAAESGFSRNVVEHEYPGQAAPYFEDLGRRARTWNVEAYVLGDDYQTTRDRLVAAVDEEEGPGELVHPYFGTVRVLARGVSVRESTREGRMARLAFSFVEASDARSPSAAQDPGSAVLSATGSLFTASGGDFTDTWNPIDEPAILVEAGTASASTFWDYLRDLRLGGPIAKVGAWRESLEELVDTTSSRLLEPSRFAEDVTAQLEGLLDAIGSRSAGIEAFLGFDSIRPSPSFGSSSASRLADSNRDAVGRLFRESAAALAARASAEATWTTYPDALAARGRALLALQAAQDNAGDRAFLALGEVARALAEALPLAPGTLPNLEPYQVRETTSSLVLAYQLFDDVSRAAEIADRNRIRNPLVIVGGQTLEVLSRA